MNVIPSIISIIANIVYYVFLQIDLFTDRYYLPGSEEPAVNHRNAIDSLFHANMNGLLDLEMLFIVVSVVTGIILLLGVKKNIVRIIWCISTIASTVMFIIIMIAAANVHLTY